MQKKRTQNISNAVMSTRVEPAGSLELYPTHPWATRTLVEHVIKSKSEVGAMSCWEPACGRGHMSRTLLEYFGAVRSSDIYPYGYGEVSDFLNPATTSDSVDWVITNPPFSLANNFILKGLEVARVGVAIFARTAFVESEERWENLFYSRPPTHFAPFVQRVPLLRGRLEEKASSATSYSWFVWKLSEVGAGTSVCWIPPCREQLKRAGDYDFLVSPLGPHSGDAFDTRTRVSLTSSKAMRVEHAASNTG